MKTILGQISRYLDRKGIHHNITPVQFHDAYATDVHIVFADWNDERLDKLSDLLDSGWGRDRGISIGFEDDYWFCDICFKAIYRQSMHNWNWFQTEQVIMCRECCDTGDYDDDILKYLSNMPNKAAHYWLINHLLNQKKIELVEDSFASGFHAYQTDDPNKILLEYFEKDNATDYIFGIDSISPFTTCFSIYKIL